MVISEGATAYFENQAAAEAYLDMTVQKGISSPPKALAKD
jgi:hypothetical protein